VALRLTEGCANEAERYAIDRRLAFVWRLCFSKAWDCAKAEGRRGGGRRVRERCEMRRALTEGQGLPRVYGCLIAKSASQLAEMQQKQIEENVATHYNVLQPDSTQKLFVPKRSVV
jgi:hypothetical protein